MEIPEEVVGGLRQEAETLNRIEHELIWKIPLDTVWNGDLDVYSADIFEMAMDSLRDEYKKLKSLEATAIKSHQDKIVALFKKIDLIATEYKTSSEELNDMLFYGE